MNQTRKTAEVKRKYCSALNFMLQLSSFVAVELMKLKNLLTAKVKQILFKHVMMVYFPLP